MSGFYKYAQAEPDFVAVVDPDGSEHAAGDLLARANRFVHLLRSLGLEKGDSVAAVLPNGVKPVEVYLAALQAVHRRLDDLSQHGLGRDGESRRKARRDKTAPVDRCVRHEAVELIVGPQALWGVFQHGIASPCVWFDCVT